MAIDVLSADTYFTTEVLHNTEWVTADGDMKSRSLKQAERMLYQVFKKYNATSKPLPEIAIFEQAIYLLRKDETVRKAEMGVTNTSVAGISISAKGASRISPEVYQIILADGGMRVGRYDNYREDDPLSRFR
jgi:hypothetical protein